MTEIKLGSDISTKEDLFLSISEHLKLGQSRYSGWDAFHDTLFGYVETFKQEIRIINCSQLSEQDFENFSDIVSYINEDIGERRVQLVRCEAD